MPSALGSRSVYGHSSVHAYVSHLYLGRRGHSRAPDDAGRSPGPLWGPGGWTFCDAARERAIAEDIVARCLGVAADVGPRLAERVAAAVREATL